MLKPNSRAVIGLTAILVSMSPCFPVDGGGRGAISPYSESEAITVARVSRQKDAARMSMIASYAINGRKETLTSVGLQWVKGGRARGASSYRLSGSDESGAPSVVDFSEIQELSIVRTEKTNAKVRAFVKIITFPSISAQQLVDERPTYSELKEKFAKTVELWIEIETTSSGELCLKGRGTIRRMLSDLKGVAVRFEFLGLTPDDRQPEKWKGAGEGLWWAIPSVTRDEKYPYKRVIMKA